MGVTTELSVEYIFAINMEVLLWVLKNSEKFQHFQKMMPYNQVNMNLWLTHS